MVVSGLPLAPLSGNTEVFLTAIGTLDFLFLVDLVVLGLGPSKSQSSFFANNVFAVVNPEAGVLTERLEAVLVLPQVEVLVTSC